MASEDGAELRNETMKPDTFEMVGDCTDCGGTMLETFAVVNQRERHVKMECRDCDAETEFRHEMGSNPEDASPSGVEGAEIKPVSWVDCQRCDGYGEIEDPLCDLRRAMNGREHSCPNCNGSGTVARILEGE